MMARAPVYKKKKVVGGYTYTQNFSVLEGALVALMA
jgi:hypothetical protein